jgi:hypothetical protein
MADQFSSPANAVTAPNGGQTQATQPVALPPSQPVPTAPATPTASPLPPTPAPAGAKPSISAIQDTLSVNFIRDQRVRLNRQIEKDKVYSRYAAWGVAIFMIVLIAVVSIEFLMSLQEQKITASISDTKTRLSGLSTLESEYLVYAQKLKLMYALDTARAAKQEATTFFYQLVPTTDVLQTITTDNDQQKPIITFQIQSPDVFGLLSTLQIFSAQNVTDKGYLIQTKSLTRSDDGTYSFSGTLDYSKAAAMKSAGSGGQ